MAVSSPETITLLDVDIASIPEAAAMHLQNDRNGNAGRSDPIEPGDYERLMVIEPGDYERLMVADFGKEGTVFLGLNEGVLRYVKGTHIFLCDVNTNGEAVGTGTIRYAPNDYGGHSFFPYVFQTLTFTDHRRDGLARRRYQVMSQASKLLLGKELHSGIYMTHYGQLLLESLAKDGLAKAHRQSGQTCFRILDPGTSLSP